jgi:hypothetical protein
VARLDLYGEHGVLYFQCRLSATGGAAQTNNFHLAHPGISHEKSSQDVTGLLYGLPGNAPPELGSCTGPPRRTARQHGSNLTIWVVAGKTAQDEINGWSGIVYSVQSPTAKRRNESKALSSSLPAGSSKQGQLASGMPACWRRAMPIDCNARAAAVSSLKARGRSSPLRGEVFVLSSFSAGVWARQIEASGSRLGREADREAAVGP